MIVVRTLRHEEFERRKAELEARDGKTVPPELLEIAKRLVWKMKVRRASKKRWDERKS